MAIQKGSGDTTVAVSGGFDPIHVGHIRLISEARKLGDRLVVILNNDNWLTDKKGYVFMPEHERREILLALSAVDDVVITEHTPGDSDRSVSRELAKLRPNIFANGGDRTSENTPEAATCREYGIKQVFNVGGTKVQSSSQLVKQRMEPDV